MDGTASLQQDRTVQIFKDQISKLKQKIEALKRENSEKNEVVETAKA